MVEDERDTAEALAWGLAAEGYAVDVAGNGVDGLWKATENAYDVIVLDVKLPAWTATSWPGGCRGGPVDAILMLTAMDVTWITPRGWTAGRRLLPKPFSYPVLLAHLRSLTRRTLGTRLAVLSAAGLALDPAGRTATRGGVPLDLTSAEAAVLEYLLRHKGHVVSKTELLEHCWDVNQWRAGRCRGSHAPAAAQVERPGRPPAIQTVRGEGYIIRDEA